MPKMSIPAGITQLIRSLQAAWEPLKTANPIASFEEFKTFNGPAGEIDRATNHVLYTTNASRILDFHVFNTANEIDRVLGAYEMGSWSLSAINDVRKVMKARIDPAIDYIDTAHFVPQLLGPRSEESDKVYKKMQLFRWFLTKLANYAAEQRNIALIDLNKADIGFEVIAAVHNYTHDDPCYMDTEKKGWNKLGYAFTFLLKQIDKPRKRLEMLNQRLSDYANKHGLQQMSVKDTEESYVKPHLISAPIEDEQAEEKSDNSIVALSTEASLLKNKLKVIKRRENSIEEHLATLKNEKRMINDHLKELKLKVKEVESSIKTFTKSFDPFNTAISALEAQLTWNIFGQHNAALKLKISKLKDIIAKKIQALNKIKKAKHKLLMAQLQDKKLLTQIEKRIKLLVKENRNLANDTRPLALSLEKKKEEHLKQYKAAYDVQVSARWWKTGLAIVVSVLSAGLLAIPAYLIWRAYVRDEPIQKIEMTPKRYNIIKELRKRLYVNKEKVEGKPKKAVEQSDPDPDKPAIYYMDKKQAERFRFFEALADKEDPKPLSELQSLALNDSKKESLRLATTAA